MSETFRVRFAPSPTGALHIGNARTAILNWLLARHHGGSFILRIEDTDLVRSSRTSEESIIEDLRWLGLDWDEGPDVGGDRGPYRQSERAGFYRAAAESLIKNGRAFHCFCSPEELEAHRKAQLAQGGLPKYSGRCRDLDEAGRKKLADTSGQPPVVRFKVPEGVSRWLDLVKGEVAIGHENIGDFILLRADGIPTYNFAVVVDDLAMRITHVIRGDDHISNTPRQRMLYQALGASEPAFAHIPMILGPDRQRLSKRHGATSVQEYRTAGFLPEALVNYLSLLSWSSASEEEFLTVARLKQEINLERLGKSAAVFDERKLRWLNGRYIRSLGEKTLTGLCLRFAGSRAETFSREQFGQICQACRNGLEVLGDINEFLSLFIGEPPPVTGTEALEIISSEQAGKVISLLAEQLRQLENLTPESAKEELKKAGKAAEVRGKMLFMPVRLALTGRMHGPDLPSVMAVLGAQRCAELLERARKPAG